MSLRMPPEPIPFTLPATQPHAGMPLGNGTLGVLLWGGETTLHLTLNRQDYWQHQGMVRWKEGATYAAIMERIKRNPQGPAPEFMDLDAPDQPLPTRLPMGRFDLHLTAPVQNASLDVATGQAVIGESVRAIVLRDSPVCVMRAPGATVQPVPNASEEVVRYREKYSMPVPETFTDEAGEFVGWVQTIPGQAAMCAACLRRGGDLRVVSTYGDTAESAKRSARETLEHAPNYEQAAASVAVFYKNWWAQVAFVRLCDRNAQIIYDLGMFKLSGSIQPGGPAPTLQGPWVEDNKMPPWGCDYHFNINVQMCHWPMLAGNALDYFAPVTELLRGWLPKMQEYARIVMGIDDGIMLPHAADDRCVPADLSWINQFDHGSASWTALMLWDAYRYGNEAERAAHLPVLRDVTYPMLRGALRVYQAQLVQEGGVYALPLGPSPEYNEPGQGAWGRNASFQLAIIHALIRAVQEAVSALEIKEPRLAEWQHIAAHLPKVSLVNERIGLWEGKELAESHRHHSHLAGVHPFDILDVDGSDRPLIERSFEYWVRQGTGEWSGWGTTWAVILWARFGDGNAAGAMLEAYRRHFTGPNYFTRHNAIPHGFTTFRWGQDIMQLDAAMGATTAILEMLAHERGGTIHLAPAVPDDWHTLTFEGLRLPGGRFASGVRENGVWTHLEAR